MLGILEEIVKSGRPFLIICDDIDDVVNTTLLMNTLQGAIRCCVVKGIDFGDARINTMADISVAVGATFLIPSSGTSVSTATLADLGSAKKVVISRDSTVIYEGSGDPDRINERAAVIKARLNDPTTSEYDKNKFEKRLANLIGGIGIIKAGGASEAEKLNLKATIEDSILASKSAIQEGCVPGGGYIYYKASLDVMKDKAFWKSLNGDEKEGAQIVFDSLPCILRTIVENSGMSGDVVLRDLEKTKPVVGYNAKTKKYGNLLDEGILDSSKAIRVALENSVSAAAMILLTDCTVINEPESGEKKDLI
jgi:chaperonin GroEL